MPEGAGGPKRTGKYNADFVEGFLFQKTQTLCGYLIFSWCVLCSIIFVGVAGERIYRQ